MCGSQAQGPSFVDQCQGSKGVRPMAGLPYEVDAPTRVTL